jgi:transposase
VRLLTDRQARPIAPGRSEICVGEALLGPWVAVERVKTDRPREALDVDERAELARLRDGNAELRMDREFLKKTAAFLATEHQHR